MDGRKGIRAGWRRAGPLLRFSIRLAIVGLVAGVGFGAWQLITAYVGSENAQRDREAKHQGASAERNQLAGALRDDLRDMAEDILRAVKEREQTVDFSADAGQGQPVDLPPEIKKKIATVEQYLAEITRGRGFSSYDLRRPADSTTDARSAEVGPRGSGYASSGVGT